MHVQNDVPIAVPPTAAGREHHLERTWNIAGEVSSLRWGPQFGHNNEEVDDSAIGCDGNTAFFLLHFHAGRISQKKEQIKSLHLTGGVGPRDMAPWGGVGGDERRNRNRNRNRGLNARSKPLYDDEVAERHLGGILPEGLGGVI